MRLCNLEADDIYTVWAALLKELAKNGENRSPRSLHTKEILGVTLRVWHAEQNILYHPNRELNYKFAVAEWLWIMLGRDDLASLTQYNSQMARFSDDGSTLAGAYGPRLVPQFSWLLNKLQENDTRQAVGTIWTPNPEPSRDLPCTVAVQFLRRDDVLNLIVTMRSSDIWLGLPYDFFTFSQILNCFAGALGLNRGWVQFQLGSSHLYATEFTKAEEVLDSVRSGRSYFSPSLSWGPPEWVIAQFLRPDQNIPSSSTNSWQRYADVLSRPRSAALVALTT